jgi:hypothetical protein
MVQALQSYLFGPLPASGWQWVAQSQRIRGDLRKMTEFRVLSLVFVWSLAPGPAACVWNRMVGRAASVTLCCVVLEAAGRLL